MPTASRAPIQQDPSKTQLKDLPRRVPFTQRRGATAYRAFFNYMPRARFDGDRDRIYERVPPAAELVDLLLTDERQYRDQQPCDDAQLVPVPTSRTRAHDARHPSSRVVQADPGRAPPDLEGLGERGDADGIQKAPRDGANERRSGTATPHERRAAPRPRRSTTTSEPAPDHRRHPHLLRAAPPPPTGARHRHAALPEFVGGSATSIRPARGDRLLAGP